jgi:hypothetical protein
MLQQALLGITLNRTAIFHTTLINHLAASFSIGVVYA